MNDRKLVRYKDSIINLVNVKTVTKRGLSISFRFSDDLAENWIFETEDECDKVFDKIMCEYCGCVFVTNADMIGLTKVAYNG